MVTGTGVLSGAGVGANLLQSACLEGRCCELGEVPGFDPKEMLCGRGLRLFDRTAHLLAGAACLALQQARLPGEPYTADEIGVIVGSTHGSIQAIADFDQEAVREGPRYVNPQHFANTVINAPASRVATLYGLTGLNSTIATGCASALGALDYAATVLAVGRAQVIVCGSGLGASKEVGAGYIGAGQLVEPEHRTAPFHAGRAGPVLAEGAAMLVLENAECASARGIDILAEISGVGTGFDPGPSGLIVAIETAVGAAGLATGDVSCVVACARGAPEGDRVEAEALHRVLPSVPVTAPIGTSGDCLEASAALHLVVAVLVLRDRRIPPIAGLTHPDPSLSELNLVRAPLESTVEHVLVTARDPSGHCAAAILSRPA